MSLWSIFVYKHNKSFGAPGVFDNTLYVMYASMLIHFVLVFAPTMFFTHQFNVKTKPTNCDIEKTVD